MSDRTDSSVPQSGASLEQQLISALDVGAIVVDADLRVRMLTPRVRRMFDLRDSDIGRQLEELASRLPEMHVQEEVDRALGGTENVEREVSSADGSWHLMRVTPFRTHAAEPAGALVTFQDITARRLAEGRARQSEERLRLLIDSAIDYAIFAIDQTGRIDFWNSGAERMFGYTADEAVGRDFALLFTPEDRAAGVPQAEMARARQDGRASDERYHLRKSGARFYCSGLTMLMRDGSGFVKVARDLTEAEESRRARERAHHELEERVARRTAELAVETRGHRDARRRVVELLRRIVSVQEDERRRISHELHDDIGQQMTALQLAIERAQAATPECDLSTALELTLSVGRGLDFIAWELRPAVLDDLGLAAALPRFVSTWSTHTGITAACRVARYVPGLLSPDAEVAFYRILQEALHNVAKHAHAPRVDVVLAVDAEQVSLVVEDNGIGFEPAAAPRANRGLGLDGMHERAALVGATLNVESSPGSGTSVFLRCPITGGQ